MIKKLVPLISPNFREKRELIFRNLFIDLIQRGCNILDVGGEPDYWENSIGRAKDIYQHCEIVCVNPKTLEAHHKNVRCVIGNATDMSEFEDKSFDIVFSNAVIEHVGDFKKQAEMAANVQRIGHNYFVHSANYYFPIEPHYFFPFANRLPYSMQNIIARYWPGHPRIQDFSAKSKEFVRTHTRLLKLPELMKLFPNATIVKERFLGMTKSFLVHNIS
jgi:hypothetical protein